MSYKSRGRIKIEELGTDWKQAVTTYRFRHRSEPYLVDVRFYPQRDRYSVRVTHERTGELILDTRDRPEVEEEMTQDRDAMDWAKDAIREAWERKNPSHG